MSDTGTMSWQEKVKEYEDRNARAKSLKLRLTCTICGEKAKLNCPCETTQYCSVACQKIDWRERGHRTACKKIRGERAAEAKRAEAPPPREVFYGPAPRSGADEVRARIAAEHEAARVRREENPEPEPVIARYGSRCPVCLADWGVNGNQTMRICCCRQICKSCNDKIGGNPCPLCRKNPPESQEEYVAMMRRHAENEVPEAIAELGHLYNNGNGVVKSTKKAAKLYIRAVELGDASAMLSLGLLYEHGDGVSQNMKKMMQLYRMAADLGHARGLSNVAIVCARNGDFAQAFEFHMRAAEKGFTISEHNLGGLYLLENDLDEARRWYGRAAAKGFEESRLVLEALARFDNA